MSIAITRRQLETHETLVGFVEICLEKAIEMKASGNMEGAQIWFAKASKADALVAKIEREMWAGMPTFN